VRGFLRCYAIYLKLAPERILNDYASLGHGEIRPRQPSREVYGRMDVSVASGDEEGAAPAEKPAAESPRTLHGPRIHSKPPIRPGINPALVFKAGIAVVGLLVLILLIWGLKALFGGGSSEPAHNLPAAAAAAPVPRVADATVSITAQAADTDGSPVRIKVVRQSDGTELYQGPLPANEPREFPNVALYVTATQIQSVIFEYKGKRYGAPAGLAGRRRMPVDFSNR